MPVLPSKSQPRLPGVTLPPGWRYIPDLRFAVAESGTPPVQVGAGRYQFTVPGGATTAHPNAGIFAVFPFVDVFGRAVKWGASTPFDTPLWIMEIEFHTEPSVWSDSYVRIGFTDAPNVTPSAFVGADTEMQYGAGNKIPTAGIELFGDPTAYRVAYAGPYTGGNKYLRGTIGHLSGEKAQRPSVWGLDSSGVDTLDKVVYVINPLMGGAGSPGGGYIYIAAGRTAATAGDAVIEATFRVWAISSGVS